MVQVRGVVSAFLCLVAQASGLGAGSAGGADWRYFAAGGISAAVSHGYTTPLDVIKTRMQTNPEMYNGSVPAALNHILANEGAGFLLQGLAPTCVGYGIEGALKFGCYELAKPMMKAVTPSDFVNALLASTIAGGVAAIALCPPEDVRIRLVADPSYLPVSNVDVKMHPKLSDFARGFCSTSRSHVEMAHRSKNPPEQPRSQGEI